MPTIRQKQSTYAITILTFQRHRHFQRTANAELFIQTLFQHQAKSRFQLHGFVVMPDHTHILITPATNESTAKCVQYIKGGYSFAARDQSPGEIWHAGYHDHRVRDADDFKSKTIPLANNSKTIPRSHQISRPHRSHPKPSVSLPMSRSFAGKREPPSLPCHLSPCTPSSPQNVGTLPRAKKTI